MVTYDASPEAGAAEHCRSNTHSFFELLLGSKEDEGLWEEVTEAFKLCRAPQSAKDVENIAYWVQVQNVLGISIFSKVIALPLPRQIVPTGLVSHIFSVLHSVTQAPDVAGSL